MAIVYVKRCSVCGYVYTGTNEMDVVKVARACEAHGRPTPKYRENQQVEVRIANTWYPARIRTHKVSLTGSTPKLTVTYNVVFKSKGAPASAFNLSGYDEADIRPIQPKQTHQVRKHTKS